MNIPKQNYVETIRANTAYPVYRGIIGIITTILMAIAVLEGLMALGVAATAWHTSAFLGFITLLFGLATAALSFYLAKFWKEAAQIAADIADSVMDANSHSLDR